MRRGPVAWGNDSESWTISSFTSATPGLSPLADGDADNLPDIYELEMYGGTNVVGSSSTGDTDSDGLDDEAEYVAGTSATNANSRFEISVSRSPAGAVTVGLQTQPIAGAGYFGLERRYALEQTAQLGDTGSWTFVPGFSSLPATGNFVTHTNSTTNQTWSARGRVWLQSGE